MAIRVGINGFGRIGRTVFRIISQNPDRFELCGINLRNPVRLGAWPFSRHD